MAPATTKTPLLKQPSSAGAVGSRPLILTASEVRAVLDGSKTQHRVPLKKQPYYDRPIEAWRTDGHGTWYGVGSLKSTRGLGIPATEFIKAPCVPGDRLYVKEAHAWVDYLVGSELEDPVCVAFKADQTAYSFAGNKPVRLDTYAWPWDRIKWRSPALMPPWASRLTLAVESVRVQRVQDISEEDARAEGVEQCGGFMTHWGCWMNYGRTGPSFKTARDSYRSLWQVKHNADSWSRNDWVFATTFKRAEGR